MYFNILKFSGLDYPDVFRIDNYLKLVPERWPQQPLEGLRAGTQGFDLQS
jgi:hypothetical protein